MRSLAAMGLSPTSHQVAHRDAAQRRDVRGPPQPAQTVDGGVHQVVRVARPEALGEDVLHARRLEHRPHSGARDDARAGRRRLEQHTPRAEVSEDLVRNRATARQRDREHLLLGGFTRLADRVGHLVGLAEADTDSSLLIADRHDRIEREPTTALHHLGAAVHADHALHELRFGRFGASHDAPLELQSAGARAVGQRLDSTVIEVATAVEAHLADAAGLGALREQLADRGAHRHAPLAIDARLQIVAARGGGERDSAHVVDDLGIDVRRAAEHREAWALLRAPHLLARPQVTDLPPLVLVVPTTHVAAPAALPALRRMYSPSYLMPLPL